MIKKSTIFKILNIFLWLVIGSGLSIVLISGIVKERKQVCKEVNIRFLDDKLINMIDRDEVYHSLWPSQLKENPIGQSLSEIDLYKLERQLKKNPWVQSANLYFDNRNVLNIDIKQRNPVARVFTPQGNSFYLDESLQLLPLNATDYVVLPVFTNYYTPPGGMKVSDSLLLTRMISLSNFILKEPFWMAQVESIYIHPDYSFELVTQVGDQVIQLGTRSDWPQLFGKLKILYKKMSEEQLWAKYSTIQLQFKDQVVCEKTGIQMIPADSIEVDSSHLNQVNSLNNINTTITPSKK